MSPPLKPVDEETIIKLTQQTARSSPSRTTKFAGGLGGLIAEVLGRKRPTPIEFVGLKDTFAESGKPLELIKKYHSMIKLSPMPSKGLF